jgi:PIN domain nuclease of toxin-antitoxin system
MGSGLKLLLDTHALIWWLAGDAALSLRARDAIEDEANSVAVSAASAMEVATKFRIGKLSGAAVLAQDFEAIVAAQGFTELPISVQHARLAGGMNISHKDPFDRFLIAQAQADGMVLVSNEALFDTIGVRRLW